MRGVVFETGMGDGPAAPPLVEQDDAISSRIEPASAIRRAAAARPAMQEERGLALRIAAHFPMELVCVPNWKTSGTKRRD